MAQHHGGRSSNATLPHAHRPRAPIMSAPTPLTAPLAPLRPPPPVTLTAPRPETDRAANEYVETPIRAASVVAPPPSHHHHAIATTTTPSARPTAAGTVGGRHPPGSTPPAPPPPHPPRLQRPERLALPLPPLPVVVTKQPATATSFGKDAVGGAAGDAVGGGGGGGLAAVDMASALAAASIECQTRPSIMCPECGRCRCNSCQQPRPLPSRWVCNNQCFCSADTVIDYATCLCCVKGLFYHCSDSDGGGASCADEPCGCGPERRLGRWGCLAVLSCLLPCLWCYLPLRCCKSAVEACYSRHSRQGCRCRPPHATPEKRLLEDNSPDL